jgi:hypothetical protein
VKGKTEPVYQSNRPVYRAREFIGMVLGWEPDRFVYRARSVPPPDRFPPVLRTLASASAITHPIPAAARDFFYFLTFFI